MKKRIKKRSLKKTAKYLRRDIKNLEIENENLKENLKKERENLIYEIAELDDLKREKENNKFTENFNKHYGFIKKLVG